MKIIIPIIFLTGLSALFIASGQKNLTYNEVILLMDVTDKEMIVPKTNEILPIFNLEQRWNGADFSVASISDISFAETYHVSIEPSNKWNDSQPLRDKKIKQFKSDVSGRISDVTKQIEDKDNSAVYFAIATKLNLLAKSKAKRKVLLVYSDLIENTDYVSFYRYDDLNLLKTKPEAIQEKFERLLSLSDLHGVEVYFIFRPADMKADELFQSIVVGVYKTMLESKRAEVHISSNLSNG